MHLYPACTTGALDCPAVLCCDKVWLQCRLAQQVLRRWIRLSIDDGVCKNLINPSIDLVSMIGFPRGRVSVVHRARPRADSGLRRAPDSAAKSGWALASKVLVDRHAVELGGDGVGKDGPSGTMAGALGLHRAVIATITLDRGTTRGPRTEGGCCGQTLSLRIHKGWTG